MEFDTLSFDIDGVSTVVKAIGKGPAVIALHGASTIEGHQWARALADRFRVYLPFHPGFGESGPAPHVRGMQDLVIHYLHLLPALKVDRPHLVGSSMGFVPGLARVCPSTRAADQLVSTGSRAVRCDEYLKAVERFERIALLLDVPRTVSANIDQME